MVRTQRDERQKNHKSKINMGNCVAAAKEEEPIVKAIVKDDAPFAPLSRAKARAVPAAAA